MAEKDRKSGRKIYDEKTGLPIMINLYIIKYIYYHIDKADCFFESMETGKKPKSYPIYQRELPISRQRFDRINSGMKFELTPWEQEFITEKYGIDTKYFRKENPIVFDIEGISLNDWKCFYRHRYEVAYNFTSGMTLSKIEERADKVESALKKLVRNDWKTKLRKDDPLYAICYYFCNGEKTDAPSSIEWLLELLKRIDYTEWKKRSEEMLKEDYKLLEKHCRYIESYLAIKELENEIKN